MKTALDQTFTAAPPFLEEAAPAGKVGLISFSSLSFANFSSSFGYFAVTDVARGATSAIASYFFPQAKTLPENHIPEENLANLQEQLKKEDNPLQHLTEAEIQKLCKEPLEFNKTFPEATLCGKGRDGDVYTFTCNGKLLAAKVGKVKQDWLIGAYLKGHPNILDMYAYFQDPESEKGLLIMEFIKGKSFYDYTDAHSEPHAAHSVHHLIEQLFNVSKHLLTMKINPEDCGNGNMMITEDGTLKLFDFGLYQLPENFSIYPFAKSISIASSQLATFLNNSPSINQNVRPALNKFAHAIQFGAGDLRRGNPTAVDAEKFLDAFFLPLLQKLA